MIDLRTSLEPGKSHLLVSATLLESVQTSLGVGKDQRITTPAFQFGELDFPLTLREAGSGCSKWRP